MSIIATDALTKQYGPRRGIDAVSLAVPEGSLFGFLGPNGAGKTTTIRVLLGLLRATSGGARIFGMDCWRHSARIKAEVGTIPGDLRLYPWLTGEGALRLFGRIRRRDLIPEGRKLADRLALPLNVAARRMSRGMRQKLGLVLAMAHRPRLLVLDEPTSSLDPLVQDTVRLMLKEHAEAGNTVFFSSHSLAEVEQLCDRVAIVRDGRIVANTTLDALRRRAGHEVIVQWKKPPDAGNLTGLEWTERNGAAWKGDYTGAVSRLLEWLATAPVEDVSIGRPDLESLFRRYYTGAPEERP